MVVFDTIKIPNLFGALPWKFPRVYGAFRNCPMVKTFFLRKKVKIN
jgi:hypothetical protein